MANRVTSDGTYTYSYDAEGNLTEKTKGAGLETWYYTYDGRNLLTNVTETSDGTSVIYEATYTYDALYHRVQQVVFDGTSTVTTRNAFDSNGRVWAELSSSNVVQARYLNGDGATDVFARIDVGANTTAWVIQDRLGSELKKVHMISISIDPEQDTPNRLRDYAHKFSAGSQWQHYTGTVEASVEVQKAFDAYRGDKMSHDPLTLLRAAPGKPWVRVEGFATADDLFSQYRHLAGVQVTDTAQR